MTMLKYDETVAFLVLCPTMSSISASAPQNISGSEWFEYLWSHHFFKILIHKFWKIILVYKFVLLLNLQNSLYHTSFNTGIQMQHLLLLIL